MSTKINDRNLFEKRNDSDVINRLVIAGLLNVLNNSLTYEQVWEDSSTGVQKVKVPFFYEFGTSNTEKFLQDNYLFFGDACNFPKITGNFDMYPRGTLQYSSSSIEASNITNRFVLGNYTKKDASGNLEAYVSFLYSIPLNMTFSVSVKCDTLITAFKIEQAIREFFYKNVTFYFLYRGMKVPVRAGFSENIEAEKTVNYKMAGGDEAREITLTFSIVAETYQPVFDPTTEMKASNKIKNVAYNISLNDSSTGSISFADDYSNTSIPSGTKLYFQWNYLKTSGDLSSTNIEVFYEDHTSKTVDTVVGKTQYVWEIPEDFSGFEPIEVVFINSDHCSVHREPSVKIIPDASTKMVSSDGVFVEDKGFFLTKEENDTIEANMYFTDSFGNTVEKAVTFSIVNNQINEASPCTFTPFAYTGVMNPKKIDLRFSDLTNSAISYTMENILIF